MQPPTHFDNYDDSAAEAPDDEDTLSCKRCGKPGLYWMPVTQADGRSDKHLLFDLATKRRHVCPPVEATDVFTAVQE